MITHLLFLLSLVAPHSRTGQPDWVKVAMGRGITVYIDSAAVVREGTIRTASVRDDLAAAGTISGTTFQFDRTEARVTFNCATHTYQVQSIRWFLGGRLVKTEANHGPDRQKIYAGSAWSRIEAHVCS